jgi:hypothetical protein
VTKARSCVGCQRQEAAPIAPCRLAALHSGHRRGLFSMTRNGQLDWSLDAREGTCRCTKTGLPEHSFHSTRNNTLSLGHPLGEKQLLLPISSILLQVGRLRWTTARQGDSHLQGCIAGASRALPTARTGTWASVVSRVGTLIDKRQPLTLKLHVRMNLHGTYARAPYSELELIHTLFLA